MATVISEADLKKEGIMERKEQVSDCKIDFLWKSAISKRKMLYCDSNFFYILVLKSEDV